MTSDASTETPCGVEPLLFPLNFIGTERGVIERGLDFVADNGGKPIAFVIDSIMQEDGAYPELGISLLVERSGEFSQEDAGEYLHLHHMQKAVAALMKSSSDIIFSYDHLSGHLPFRNHGRYIRSFIMEDVTILTVEESELWLQDNTNGYIDDPDDIETRCQVCTILIPDRESGHQRVEMLANAKSKWQLIEPHLVEHFQPAAEALHIKSPDFTRFPDAP